MTRIHPLAILAILLAQCHSLGAQAQTAPMLEVHVSTPKWVNGCLEMTVERVNTSSQTVYIPEWADVYFLLSTSLIHNDPSKKNENVWVPVYGLSDIVTFDAHPLTAGSKATEDFCLPGTATLVDKQKKTRRQVVLRGHVKIVASYFPTEEDWRTKKAEKEKEWPKPWPAPAASLEIILPCSPQAKCAADCKAPPLITEGERVVLPDIFAFHKDWNERGKTLADTLSRQYSECKN